MLCPHSLVLNKQIPNEPTNIAPFGIHEPTNIAPFGIHSFHVVLYSVFLRFD